MTPLVIADVEVDGRRCDVHLAHGRVTGLQPPQIHRKSIAQVVGGDGGALLPGLHDHHIHLFALARAAESVDCSPAAAHDTSGLVYALRRAPAQAGWVRGVGYHESISGPLDRHTLDRIRSDVPVRVQHRSGALWMLNSAALDRVQHVLDDTADVERDGDGNPTGRLWRYDDRLRPALPHSPPDLAATARRLASYGITGLTDATPDLDPAAVDLLAVAADSGAVPQRLTLLGAPTGAALPAGLTGGPRKLLLRDHDLPDFDDLAAEIAHSHRAGRPVAVHCVTRESLVLTVVALEEVGALAGDRVEHAAVVPDGLGAGLARLGVAVVTQPDFLRTRGEDYLRDVDPADLPHLYPYAGLLSDGVRVACSSDAPYGDPDPWRVIRSATSRATSLGRTVGAAERVSAATALAGYLSPADDPGGAPRRIAPGLPADLVLLDRPLAAALADPTRDHVRAVWIAGEPAA